MLSDSLVESFRSRLEALGLELADLRIGGTQARPLVQVRIEWPPALAGPDAEPRRVTVVDCATASRVLEAWLDGEGPLGRRYMLEVSSPGVERPELLDLLKDGLHAALVKRYGPNVRAEIGIDELKGTIRIAVLRTVVETVEDPGTQVALEEARFEDADFQVGDVLEEEVPFEAFGRTAVQAAKQRIIQRVREGERARIREEFSDKVGA